jgi:hypothetical protein
MRKLRIKKSNKKSFIGLIHRNKQLDALVQLDSERDETLRKVGTIGFVRQGTSVREHFRPRPVTFKWQRGIKIGQGRFGKVIFFIKIVSQFHRRLELLGLHRCQYGIGSSFGDEGSQFRHRR